jgi:uncharacterized membrane protein YgcG
MVIKMIKGIARTAVLFLALFAAVASAQADERILDFHSNIKIAKNGDMTVRETIVVQAEGRQIRRGIYRDFPTDYKDRFGNQYRVGFQILSVRRDGQREDYHTKTLSNGIRIYFGNKNRFISHGRHEYELTYRTNRQLGFFKDHDELYWNVTGNGWNFAIDHAAATVRLPAAIPVDEIRPEAYTGGYGSKGQDYIARVNSLGEAQFETTRMLGPRQGLTIVVSFPKGFVHEPTTEERLQYLIDDNRGLIYMAAGLGLVFVYYLFIWYLVGRDQPEGVIVPLYYPPKGFSPASLRFIERRGYDNKAFATALVNLAVKGVIKLKDNKGDFTVERKNDVPEVKYSPGERILLDKLLGESRSLKLTQTNHARIAKAIDAHKNSLKRDYEKIYFIKNIGWFFLGILGSIATLVVGGLNTNFDKGAPAIFLMVWLSIWSIAVYMLAVRAIGAWKSARSKNGYGNAVTASIIFGVFGFFEVFAITMFLKSAPFSLLGFLLLVIGVNVGFYHWLSADTRAGRKLIDQAEGFRLYLDVAEGDELKMRGAPTKTTDLFEMYLPYALALDVEQHWAERFASIFADLEKQGRPYTPIWYSGSHWNYNNLGDFTNTIGNSLSSTISSSSTAPGSSSGSGGGGFSGGGGGGGGGGGW